jgi:sodium/potassium/calcium exchanger 6
LTNWSDKNIFDKLLGLVASLPVFLLTITLPVVEPQKDENDGGQAELSLDFGLPPAATPHSGSMDSHTRSVSLVLPLETPADMGLSKSKLSTSLPSRQPNGGSFSTFFAILDLFILAFIVIFVIIVSC